MSTDDAPLNVATCLIGQLFRDQQTRRRPRPDERGQAAHPGRPYTGEPDLLQSDAAPQSADALMLTIVS